jgi:2-oxo-3-hexenedioate decarboxylase
MIDPRTLANELRDAYVNREVVCAPSSREGGLDLAAAYATERELVRLREQSGSRTAGLKVGFANRAMWRALKLDTLVWAHIYDDTVRFADRDQSTVSLEKLLVPKIEPEIVFKLRESIAPDADAAAILGATEWLALGFEIIDCVYPDWKFTPADFVAAYGFHAGLIVGTPLPVTADRIPSLIEQLAAFTVTLRKNGESVAQGAGKNSLKSPALCLGELSSASAKAGDPLKAGDLVSSGTLTEAQLISPGETFTAVLDGLNLPPLTVATVA